MPSGWRGMATGALSLVALELLVQPGASGRVSGLFGLPASWAAKFLDPTVPTFHTSGSGSGSAAPPPPIQYPYAATHPDQVSTTPPNMVPGNRVGVPNAGRKDLAGDLSQGQQSPDIYNALAGAGGGTSGGDLLPQLLNGQKRYGLPQNAT